MESFKTGIKLLLPKYQKLILDYKVNFKPRYTAPNKPHQLLYSNINEGRDRYKTFLQEVLKYEDVFKSLKTMEEEKNENAPAWNNGFLPGLDIVALYTMIAKSKPKTYIEIGSGNSTKVVRKAIVDNNLDTKVISIDPFPRASIDHLADEVIRRPVEDIGDYRFIFKNLGEGDILFIDNSHRCLPNSDVTTCFMDILPYLKDGVIVYVHDIYLPYDYPQFMCDRFYSEQYILAAFLMANSKKYEVLFPAFFVSEDSDLSSVLSEMWGSLSSGDIEKHGGSFWFKILG